MRRRGTAPDGVSGRLASAVAGALVGPLLLAAVAGAGTEIPLRRAQRMARRYLAARREELGLALSDVADVVVTDAYTSSDSGTRHIYLRQRWQGIEVFSGNFTLNLSPDGRPFFVGDRFVRNLEQKIASPATPALSAAEAVQRAAAHLGLAAPHDLRVLDQAPDAARTTRLSDGGVSRRAIPAHLVWAEENGSGRLRLAWDLQIEPREGKHHWRTRIDAATGATLGLDDSVDREQYRVYPIPEESPDHATPAPPEDGRTLVVDPYLTGTASPFGWHDTDGSAGADHTTTEGNNVKAYPDRLNDGSGSPVDCGETVSCDFPVDLSMDPSAYTSAAVANLFYWVNIVHDVLYQYGFDETAGNFQENNYGHGGAAGDSVMAEAQDSAGLPATGNNRCNAFFDTPPDGESPTLEVYVCNDTPVARDSDLDNGVLVHECGHGLSNRLTGGAYTTSCLDNAEQMGEGWSDFLALVLTMQPGDSATDPRPFAAYSEGQPATAGPGWRAVPYSTDLAVDGYTYADVASYSEPHFVGFIWGTMLWDVAWKLIDEHGFNPDIYSDWTTGGNNLALQLVVDGLKLQACSPGFVDGRDAILAADHALTGGANECPIWYGFAKRGLGATADQGSSTSTTDGKAAFDLPEGCQGLTAAATTASACSVPGKPARYTLTVGDLLEPDVVMTASLPGATLSFDLTPVPGPLPAETVLTVSDASGLSLGTHNFEAVAVDTQHVEAHLGLTLEVTDLQTSPPTPVSPDDGAGELNLRPELQWSGASPGSVYAVEIDDDPSFASPDVTASGIVGTRYRPTVALAPETTYYWRVKAANPCYGDFSPPISFTTTQAGKLVAPDGAPGDGFGTAVAIRDDLVAVGAPFAAGPGDLPGVGKVYLYGRNEGGADAWTRIDTFSYDVPGGGEHFGAAVAVNEDVLAVGAPGADGGVGVVEVYERNQGGADAWGKVATLQLPGSGQVGAALALDGDTLVVGAPGDDTGGQDAGRAAVFSRAGGSWALVHDLAPLNPAQTGDRYGAAVAVSHGWAAVGAPFDDTFGNDAGKVRMFERNSGGADQWGQRAGMGPTDGTPENDQFGWAVALDLDTLMVGAPGDDDNGATGSVRVLLQNQGGADEWDQLQEIHASDDSKWSASDSFGVAVAVHGDLAVVGRADFGQGGEVYLLENGAVGPAPWVEVAASGASDGPGAGYGDAVAIDDGAVVTGSRYDDPRGNAGAGSAYLIQRQPTGFSQTTKVLGPSTGHALGNATAISGGTMVAASTTSDLLTDLPIVYRRDASGGWSPVTTLRPVFDPNADGTLDEFGFSVAVDGDVAVVGDPYFSAANDGSLGTVFVFRRNQGGPDNWGQVARLVASDQATYHDSEFGRSVAIDGDLIVVGDPYHESNQTFVRPGAVYLFRRNEGGPDHWGQLGPYLDGGVYADDGDEFGESVAVSGRHLLVGADYDEVSPGDIGGHLGVGYLFDVIGGSAVMKARLLEPDPYSLDLLGWVSDLDGADAYLDAANHSGVNVYSRNLGGADAWGVRVQPCAADSSICTEGGAIDGGLIIAGGETDRVNTFARNQGGADQWGHDTSLAIVPDDPGKGNRFGYEQFDIGLDRGNAIVGAFYDSDNGTATGAAYVFHLEGTWNVTPPMPPGIFADDFESGGTSRWSKAKPG